MRLLTYNIHKGIGGRDRRYRLERILDVIEAQNPDLVLLQEVDSGVRRSHHHDQPTLLTEWLGAHSGIFQLNVALKEGGYGNLLLSRWPIAEYFHIDLRMSLKKPRAAQLARVATPEGDLAVVNWHLGLADIERVWQIERLLRHPAVAKLAHLPMVMAGDSNDWRDRLQGRVLKSQGFRQVTSPPSRFRSFPATLPVGSLDKAYVRGDIDVGHARVCASALAKEASDHLPLIVDFHLRPASLG